MPLASRLWSFAENFISYYYTADNYAFMGNYGKFVYVYIRTKQKCTNIQSEILVTTLMVRNKSALRRAISL